MDINAKLYFDSAKKLGLPVKLLKEIYGFRLILGKGLYFFRGAIHPFNDAAAANVAANKYSVNKILEQTGLPVPKAIAFNRDELLNNTWDIDALTFPVVLKPTCYSRCGTDVLCGIPNLKVLKRLAIKLFARHEYLSVEKFHANLNTYRVLVFHNKVIGVTHRVSSRVIGDGKHNILELINIANEERQNFKSIRSFGKVKLDEESFFIFKKKGITPKYIPSKGEVIKLCDTCNSSRGGTMVSMGDKICKENARLLCKAAKVLSLNLVGFDVVCEDINLPMVKTNGVIIEANTNADLTIHEAALSGERNLVSKKIMQRFLIKHPIIGGCYFLKKLLVQQSDKLKSFFPGKIIKSYQG